MKDKKVPVSAFVTTYNNQRTLRRCLTSLLWADEIVVLDSYSTDSTPEVAKEYGCRFFRHAFLGYGPQKQLALSKTKNEWVFLLDADEVLSEELQQWLVWKSAEGFDADGYSFPRVEQVFWEMAHPKARHNYYLRLFNKKKGRITDMPIHAAPEVDGKVVKINKPFYHYGEVDIHTKVDKINHYSTGLVKDKVGKGKSGNPLKFLVYPPLAFFKTYVFKRTFLNGWAGFIAAVISGFYTFLKYAKLYEYYRLKDEGDGNRLSQSVPGRKGTQRSLEP